MAFLYFTRSGGLSYNIRVEADNEVIVKDYDNNDNDDGDNDQVTAITIDNGKRSKRLLTVIPGLERFLTFYISYRMKRLVPSSFVINIIILGFQNPDASQF